MSGLDRLESSGTEPIGASVAVDAIDLVFEEEGMRGVDRHGNGKRPDMREDHVKSAAVQCALDCEAKLQLPGRLTLELARSFAALLREYSQKGSPTALPIDHV